MCTHKDKQRTAEVPKDTCVICGNEVGQENRRPCSMTSAKWEHVTCVRIPDRMDDTLYEALTKCRSKAIMYYMQKMRVTNYVIE